MNIFYLDHDPQKCAEMHVDKHCVKMILEYAQLLSTTHRFLDGVPNVVCKPTTGRKQTKYILADGRDDVLYSATHINHPSTVWVRQSNENYIWLNDLWQKLMGEYTYRYGKKHACEKLMGYLASLPVNIPNKPFTEPTPAMPDDCKIGDVLLSYRKYYIEYKNGFAKWKNRERPDWYVT